MFIGKVFLSLALIFVGLNSKGQSIDFKLSKNTYKVNEDFIMLFESSIKIDSIGEFLNV